MVYIQLDKFQPAAHFLLVRINKPKETKSGIVLPDNFKTKVTSAAALWFATVIKFSSACDLRDSGCPDLKAGDIIGTTFPLSACIELEDADCPGAIYTLLADGEIHALCGQDELLASEKHRTEATCSK